MTDLHWMTAHELADLLAAGDVSSVDIAEAVIARTEDVEPKLDAFLTRTDDRLRADAKASDERRRNGETRSRFDGVPIGYKDVFVTKGIQSTSGSRILEGFIPPYDATVVDRGTAAGLPLHGKLNMDEFAMGSSGENSGFKVTRNPWDLERVPGGSSSGPAAAVAAGVVPWAWGTDTGGSVRQPAALTGVVGVKPTYGRISRFGMIAFASSLDQAGPFTRSVKDAAALIEIVAGGDRNDSTCLPESAPDLLSGIDAGIDGMRIGLIKEVENAEGIAPGVRSRVDEAYARLEKLGATLEEVSLPSFEHGISAYYLVAPAECSANLARFDGVRYGLRVDADDIVSMMSKTRDAGFGDEVKRRIMLGTYALSAGYYDAYYGKAQKVRTLIMRDLERAYESVDVIASPTAPTTAFRLGEKTDDPLAMYLNDVFTVPYPLAGNGAVSVPCGTSADDGLPVGLQLAAAALDEPTLFRAAYAFEQDLAWAGTPESRPSI
ncbi:MAG: Asp-tRNA(Asn)/Glu-tRNA(Gln) amidotransferase subunit GatA [Actinobacteria bacterium]|nr:Asp-tRNA(Asn)/Glu-tRNA(Gln) amidotransferase subunit GatA [Actinomycetota bacterium]